MSVDPYSLCPCGSGKKLKFCCSDLLHDIEKIHRMLEGDQPRAALNHVTQTLRRAPRRGSLLDMKAMLELSLEEWEDARRTIADFQKADPNNPAAYAQAAVLAASREGGAAAVASLQDALERLGEEMPARVMQAVGSVGQALLVEGNLVAARAHLWLYQGIAGRDDTRAMDLLTRLNQSGGLPLLLRDQLYLREAPAGHPAEAAHDHAQLLASRGQWRRAAAELDELCGNHPDLAMLHYNRGLIYGWLGDSQRLVEGLRAFADRVGSGGVSTDDAIEATAIAGLLDAERREPPIEVVRTTFGVGDEEQLIDRLGRDRRAYAYRLDPSELAAIEGPPPRSTHLLLDRELPASGAGIDGDATPRVIGALSYFGRRTDMPERLELVADRDAGAVEALRALAGSAVGEASGEEVIGQAPSDEPSLRPRLQFPDDTPIDRRREVLADVRRAAVLETWPDKPRVALDGKPPKRFAEHSRDDKQAFVLLSAEVLNLEQSLERGYDEEAFRELKRRLSLPEPEAIDPATTDFHTLPLTRLGRVDLSAVDDEDLLTLYERAVLAGAAAASLQIAREAIERPSMVEETSREELYQRIVSLEPDTDEAIRWLDRARSEAEAAGRSSAPWDILELEIAVVSGRLEDANRLVEHLRRDHLQEPGVAEQLYQLLYALGVAPGPGEAAPAAPMPAPPLDAGPTPAPEAPSAGSKLWTPGSDAAPAAAAPQGGSKIWTPT